MTVPCQINQPQIFRHQKQGEAFIDPARFKFILAGRRGGKTRLVREDIVQSIWDMPPGSEIFYIGPTLSHAYELIWDALDERLYPTRLKYKPMISKRRFEIQGGRLVYVIGAEKIKRIRGHKVFKVYLDEIAFFEEDLNVVWNAVRPTLTDLEGKAVLTTTPLGKGTQAYDFYLNILSKPEWKYFHWQTIDNPFIKPDEIEKAKAELDPKSFAQEYLAEWQSFEGLCYYCFNENTHIKSNLEVNPELGHIMIAQDFNVNPTTLLVGQHYGNIKIIKEYSFKNSSTIDTVKSFCEDHKHLKDNVTIEIYGDSAGSSRSHGTGKSDYFYTEEILTSYGFKFQKCVRAANPSIIDRVAYVNSWLKNTNNESRIEIDANCKDLIRDLSSQEIDGRMPSKKNNLGHKADALGYLVTWKQISNMRGNSKQIQL